MHSAGHEDVGEQKIDRRVLAQNLQSLGPAAGGQHPIAQARDQGGRGFAYQLVVIDDQDRVGAFWTNFHSFAGEIANSGGSAASNQKPLQALDRLTETMTFSRSVAGPGQAGRTNAAGGSAASPPYLQ